MQKSAGQQQGEQARVRRKALLSSNIKWLPLRVTPQRGRSQNKLSLLASAGAFCAGGKIITVLLASLLVGLALKYFSLHRQILTAAFVSHHSEICRQSVRDAEAGLAPRDVVLHDLSFFVGYYDGQTNTLRGFPLLDLLRAERERTVGAAVAYLRKHSTNDYGDDPYRWIKDD